MAKVPAVSKSNEVAQFDASKFTIARRLVVPSISIKGLKEGDAIYFRAEGEIELKDQIDEKTGEVKEAKLPTIHATDLTTGQYGQLVLPAIAFRGFSEAGELKGRLFGMQKGRSLGVGKANIWEVVELASVQ